MEICSKGFTFENCIYSPSDCGANCNKKIEVKMRNFDKIKNMNIEEMAEFFRFKMFFCSDEATDKYECDKYENCTDCIKQWLESEE